MFVETVSKITRKAPILLAKDIARSSPQASASKADEQLIQESSEDAYHQIFIIPINSCRTHFSRKFVECVVFSE